MFVICDVCLKPPPGGMTNFVRDGRLFHVCRPCEDKPFHVPPSMRATVTLSPGAGVEVFASRRKACETCDCVGCRNCERWDYDDEA